VTRWGEFGIVGRWLFLFGLLGIALAGCGGVRGARHPVADDHSRPGSRPTRTAAPIGSTVGGLLFTRASTAMRTECEKTADAVGYEIPCPTMLPAGIAGTPGMQGCPGFQIVGWDRVRGCGAVKWRGWMVGSSNTSAEHLVVLGAPRVVRNPARAIDGPGMQPGSRVQPRGVVMIEGKVMRWYYVPPTLNVGSAFMHHLVLVWTASGHTYAYGFHVVDTFADARALDLELVRHLVTDQPRGPR
jgi:hypothetical protein